MHGGDGFIWDVKLEDSGASHILIGRTSGEWHQIRNVSCDKWVILPELTFSIDFRYHDSAALHSGCPISVKYHVANHSSIEI